MTEEAGHYVSVVHHPPVACDRCGGTGRTAGVSSLHGPYPERTDAIARAATALREGFGDVSVFHVLPDLKTNVT